jgi:hypothetical protein
MKMETKAKFSFRQIFFISLFLGLSLHSLVNAQPFGPQNVLSSGSTTDADQVEITDVNQDNLPDIITSCDLGLTWFENTGEGNFNFQETIFSQYPLCDFAIADFNGDNSPDLLMASTDSNTLCWSANDGTGGYDSVIIINNDSLAPKYLVVCDLDMDGDQDFLISYSPYNRSLWYQNDGEGNFTQAELNTVPYTGKATTTWDFDFDTDPDLLIYNDGNLEVLENDGNGIFSVVNQISVFFWIGLNQWTGDLDGDFDEDLVIYDDFGDEVKWIENTGSLENTIIHSIGTQYGLRSLCFADFDLDYDLDIVTGTYSSGLTVFENLGMGIFSDNFQFYDNFIIPAVNANDLDQDGYPDLVVLYGDNYWLISDQAAWFKGNGEMTFEDPELLTSILYGPHCVVVADLDGDNAKDIITVSWGDNKIGWFRNNGYHCYAPFELITDTLITQGGCESSISAVVADDLDLDGDIDLIAYSCDTYVLLNDGSGKFSNVFTFGYYLTEVWDMCLEDLDDDGYKDIVAAGYVGILAFRNNGDGSFTQTFLLPIYWWYNYVTSGDIDGDQDADIIFGALYFENIGFALNDGTGEFSNPSYDIEIDPQYNFRKVRAADLDNDSDLDILSLIDYKIVWFEHLDNAWGEEQVIVPGTIRDFCLADLDGDDDQDILYPEGSQIIWIANDGAGNFAEGKVITTEVLGGSNVFTYDLDNDGDPDVLSTSFDEDKVAWYENLRLPVALPEPSLPEEAILVFPIPAKDFVNIRCSSGNIRNIKVLDITGKDILHLNNSSVKNILRIDLSKLKPGIYFIEIHTDKGRKFTRKSVKI